MTWLLVLQIALLILVVAVLIVFPTLEAWKATAGVRAGFSPPKAPDLGGDS